MKSSFAWLVLVLLLLNILAGYAPGPNQSKGTASEHDGIAGFWLGLWQGFIAPFVFVASLFKSNLSIYEGKAMSRPISYRLSMQASEKRWMPYRGMPGVNHLAYEVDDVDWMNSQSLPSES